MQRPCLLPHGLEPAAGRRSLSRRLLIRGSKHFQLTTSEYTALMLQNATSKPSRGGRRKLALAFTEHGAIMTPTILNTPRAVETGTKCVTEIVGGC
jgi:hypothetical protein